MTRWRSDIGLEVHARLKTRSKLFSGAAAQYGASPNEQVSPIDAAFPGVLPVLNEAVIKMAIAFGLAINAEIARRTVFARKSYFYPDLPKGYQISQYEFPIVIGGTIRIALADAACKSIAVTRAHLEEDAGRLLHSAFEGMSGVDLNRAGTPLMEIVSAPDMCSAMEAGAYMRKIHSIVRYLGICDGNMQEGSFRCDANVSVRPSNSSRLGVRTELKNINSFRFIEKAIDSEINRQIQILENGGTIQQETRLYNASSGQTYAMRTKEQAHDYRYFPDPDLLPVVIDETLIRKVQSTLPELPEAKSARFSKTYDIMPTDIERLVADRATADYFEACMQQTKAPAQTVANWISGTVTAMLNRSDISIQEAPVSAAMAAQLFDLLHCGTLSTRMAQEVFAAMWRGDGTAEEIVEQKQLQQVDDDTELRHIIETVITDNPRQLAQYRSGKKKVFGYFVGQVMQATQGRANPREVNCLLNDKLSKLS